MIYLSMLETQDNREKFEQLYLAYRQLMFHTANSILNDASLAEDAVHQAFLRILAHMDGIGEIECPRTKNFVVIIVRNIAINFYNRRKRKVVVALDELDGWLVDGAPQPSETVEAQEDFQRLANLIENLPEGYRSVLLLKYDNGFSTAEIAKLLELSEENVKKRIQRARKKLAERMGEVSARDA